MSRGKSFLLWFTGRGLLSLKVILERKNGILEKLMLSSIEIRDHRFKLLGF